MKDCIFCKIVSKDVKSEIIDDSNEDFIVLSDANPVSEGHCLIVPRKHYATLFDLPASLGSELVSIAKQQGLRLIKEGKADGIKLVNNNFKAAGQVVNHFHLHIIPEKDDFKRDKHV